MPRRLAVAVACGTLIAACGSSSPSSHDTAKGYSRALAFSKCMRSHGVPNFPDPTGSGAIQIGSGINPFSPAFKAAQSACNTLLPGGGPGNGPPSEQAKQQMLAISTCMRADGVTDFPDPTTSPPSSPAGYSAVLGRRGVFLAVPSTINTSSPAFTQAAAACKFGPRGAPVPNAPVPNGG